MNRTPMFLMLLLATALSDNQSASVARGTKSRPGSDAAGMAQQTQDGDSAALEEARLASARRMKPAA